MAAVLTLLLSRSIDNGIQFDIGSIGDTDILVEFAVQNVDTKPKRDRHAESTIDVKLATGHVKGLVYRWLPSAVGRRAGIFINQIQVGLGVGPSEIDTSFEISTCTDGEREREINSECWADDKDVRNLEGNDTVREDLDLEREIGSLCVLSLEAKHHWDVEVRRRYVDCSGLDEWTSQFHCHASVHREVTMCTAVNTEDCDSIDCSKACSGSPRAACCSRR